MKRVCTNLITTLASLYDRRRDVLPEIPPPSQPHSPLSPLRHQSDELAGPPKSNMLNVFLTNRCTRILPCTLWLMTADGAENDHIWVVTRGKGELYENGKVIEWKTKRRGGMITRHFVSGQLRNKSIYR